MPTTFLAYTITAPLSSTGWPVVRVGSGGGSNETFLKPSNTAGEFYWIVILNAQNPRQIVKQWTVPAQDNQVVPGGIEVYLDNPAYLFVVATQALRTTNVPLDSFYNFLAKYGAGPELQKLEQIHSAMGYSAFGGRVGYILTGQCGPRVPPKPPTYEVSAYSGTDSALLTLSLASMPNGQPPYGISDAYTWIPRTPRGQSFSEEYSEK